MPPSSAARKDAGTAARPGQAAEVPRQRGGQVRPAQQAKAGGQGGISMPSVPVPHIRFPAGNAGKVLWWGGLAAAAAFGVVDWPVAALIAAGTWVAEQHAREPSRGQAAG
jgi:hypothetical protein